MKRRRSRRHGPAVGEIGLGCMGMSDFYGPADRTESLATIRAAMESGVTLIDTADFHAAVRKDCAKGERYAPFAMAHLDSETKG